MIDWAQVSCDGFFFVMNSRADLKGRKGLGSPEGIAFFPLSCSSLYLNWFLGA
jgi:hypothetical protein